MIPSEVPLSYSTVCMIDPYSIIFWFIFCMNHGDLIIVDCKTEIPALKHIYRTIPEGQLHKKGYQSMRNT